MPRHDREPVHRAARAIQHQDVEAAIVRAPPAGAGGGRTDALRRERAPCAEPADAQKAIPGSCSAVFLFTRQPHPSPVARESPAPMPSTRRPSLTSSRVTAILASSAGFRKLLQATNGPSSIREIAPPGRRARSTPPRRRGSFPRAFPPGWRCRSATGETAGDRERTTRRNPPLRPPAPCHAGPAPWGLAAFERATAHLQHQSQFHHYLLETNITRSGGWSDQAAELHATPRARLPHRHRALPSVRPPSARHRLHRAP